MSSAPETAAKPATRLPLKARLPAAKKQAFAAVADRFGMSESALVEGLVDALLDKNPVGAEAAQAAGVAQAQAAEAEARARESGQRDRINVRLAADDRERIEKRAGARGMPTSTYIAHLVRSHVREAPPVPEAEIERIEVVTRQLRAMNDTLRQIAAALAAGGPAAVDMKGAQAFVAQAAESARVAHDAAATLVLSGRAAWDASAP